MQAVRSSRANPKKQLLVLGCSETKVDTVNALPAILLYDGPMFRVLRAFLRNFRWPQPLSLAVLSAKHGLIGGISHISAYNHRMTTARARELNPGVTESFRNLIPAHFRINLVMGKTYLDSIDRNGLDPSGTLFEAAYGPIGMKLKQLREKLHLLGTIRRSDSRQLPKLDRPMYFLPDWDDFLDADFDFANDQFSHKEKSFRRQEHSSALTKPREICDGVLVSLAQQLGAKGLLKRMSKLEDGALAPRPVRDHFNLSPGQWTFGDCGAFSYAAEPKPTISVEQAVALYELYEFDLGASVDHIPLEAIKTAAGKEPLTISERYRRTKLTRDNAQLFLDVHREQGAHFVPVGVVQGITASGYAKHFGEYVEMGYRHIALGGLVPRSDADILGIVRRVCEELRRVVAKPWIHLMGVFRPLLQEQFRTLGVNSFDSATYFRKAWLRSDQNYLGANGKWYAALRVPPASDPQVSKRLKSSRKCASTIKRMETDALTRLRAYADRKLDIDSCLSAVLRYDRLLDRGEFSSFSPRDHYIRTLEDRPWEKCDCRICRGLGIDVVIFRGYNRNKRRGAHNTLQLYSQMTEPKSVTDHRR